jgi:hypothetical protein
MKKIMLIVIVSLTLLTGGCKPGYYPCDAPPEVSVETVNGVFEGEKLFLKATATPGSTFKWTGPNDYSSTEQNPVINSITLSNEGTYRVVAEKDGCVSSAGFELKVLQKPPCTPANNTVTFNNSTYTLSNIRMTTNPSNGLITVTANHSGSSSGNLTISPLVPNKTNSYLIDQFASDFNEVEVKFYEGNSGYNWSGADGLAYVKIVNGKPEITICNSTFVSFSFPSRKLSAKITVP